MRRHCTARLHGTPSEPAFGLILRRVPTTALRTKRRPTMQSTARATEYQYGPDTGPRQRAPVVPVRNTTCDGHGFRHKRDPPLPHQILKFLAPTPQTGASCRITAKASQLERYDSLRGLKPTKNAVARGPVSPRKTWHTERWAEFRTVFTIGDHTHGGRTGQNGISLSNGGQVTQ